MQNKSTFAFKEAVRRMLTRCSRSCTPAGPEHTHQAQKPVEYKL